jgi:UDP-GlcNAc:undecaprenyl-phosphate/decaprenyl-phosphate GlcNAc-1-phosphate transferase
MIFLSTLLFSVFITIVLIPPFAGLAIRYRFVDIPDARKVHMAPIPRIGGIAMAVGALLPMLYWHYANPFVRSWLAASAVLVAFGIVDDLWGLGPKVKVVGQVMAAVFVIVIGGVKIVNLGTLLPDGMLLPEVVAVPFTLLAIVGVTNAVNLADGLDGLAGGMCLLIFCSLGLLAYQTGRMDIGLASLALGGSIFGFLKFNTYPASVFMGDTGSQLLGFSAATLSLSLTQGNTALSPVLPLLLLGLPVLDTLYVMAHRLARGVSIVAAERNHLHHRLLNLGLQQTESVLVLYLGQTVLILAAYFLRFYPESLLMAGYLLFSVVTMIVSACSDGIRWRISRSGWYDRVFKRTLKRLRDEGIVISYTFRVFENLIPLLFLVTCMVPAAVPLPATLLSLACAASLALIRYFRTEWLEAATRLIVYLAIPLVVYVGDTVPTPWLSLPKKQTYNLLFVVFTFFFLAISKFSRRRKGFKTTPMDFLVFFLIVVFSNLPDQYRHDYLMGFIAAKIVVFYYCYEVLLAELRDRYYRVVVTMFVSLLVFGLKGFLF